MLWFAFLYSEWTNDDDRVHAFWNIWRWWPSQRFVYKWAQRFRDGRKSLEDDPRSGRPETTTCLAEAISEIIQEPPFERAHPCSRIGSFSRNHQRNSTQWAGTLKICHPHGSTQSLSLSETSWSLASTSSSLWVSGGCDNVITGDETWVFHKNAHDSVLAASSEEARTRVSRTIGAKKSMVSVFGPSEVFFS